MALRGRRSGRVRRRLSGSRDGGPYPLVLRWMAWMAPMAWSGEKSVMAVSVRPTSDHFKSCDSCCDKLL
jgi:hypothetical protein